MTKNLELYRASAGSGKTYTLAKKYIWYLITIASEEGSVRLRTDSELADSARHILAVTFTNKATNEMQMRIVKRLYELAYPDTVCEIGKDGTKTTKKPEYMQDFIDELHVDESEISEVCKKALSLLLEDYSDFNVSTIDSFFQQVLRTFAFEADINDGFQVEIDSNYLSQVGVDETLEEIDNNSERSVIHFWVETIIKRTTGKNWNIFNRSLSEGKGENSYGSFIKSVGRMETEQYKELREQIEDYFDRQVTAEEFIALYNELVERFEKPLKQAYDELYRKAKELRKNLPPELLETNKRILGIPKTLTAGILDKNKFAWNKTPTKTILDKASPDIFDHKDFITFFKEYPELESGVVSEFESLCDAFERWYRLIADPACIHWLLYSVNLPYYALFSIVSQKRREYLTETNAIELAETSMILKNIIGDSDTPFVYERLGTQINHFLIDEFQDTSKMQWSNLEPLLKESLARGNKNLIIGDAKQSIYRFRNADPSLISKKVPDDYSADLELRGEVASENTNYRSFLRVVQFNNSFFEYLVGKLDESVPELEKRTINFRNLYSNIIQTPFKKKEEGYVEVRLLNVSSSDYEPFVLNKIPQLVADLLKRGYLQKEIAVLVEKKDQGSQIINAFIEYNLGRGEGDPEIKFVSEQSLKVSSSRAVNIIVSVLRNIAHGTSPKVNEGKERRYKGIANINDILANLKYYQMQHPELPFSEMFDSYFAGASDFNMLSDMLRNMQSLAIPVLVETITATFLDKDNLTERDAIFIAAFQDMVLEYCDSHPTDLGSFLRWWDRKGKYLSVTSPQNTDAVQILTIHKSKGLEYECVIVPFANYEMGDRLPSRTKLEWVWAAPQFITGTKYPMPPVMPIVTTGSMSGTAHEPALIEFFDKLKMDHLNAAYVAFTRAKKELYVFCQSGVGPKYGKKSVSTTLLGTYLGKFLEDEVSHKVADVKFEGKINPRLPSQIVKFDEDSYTYRIGEPVKEVGKDREEAPEMLEIMNYRSLSNPRFLTYTEEILPDSISEKEMDEIEDDDMDPRSEGNIKHAVLELVRVPEDLPKAVRHLSLKGIVPAGMEEMIEKSLAEAIKSDPQVERWFDASAEVINERAVLRGGAFTKRIDRLVVYPDGTAVVVDYKFGKKNKKSDNRYHRQVKEYVLRLIKTGQYKRVEGYLWYVNEGFIDKVWN